MQADGPVEFLFVVDSKGDPACSAVQAFSLQMSQHMAGGARVIVAPPATLHSQKICNIIAGIQVRDACHAPLILTKLTACIKLAVAHVCNGLGQRFAGAVRHIPISSVLPLHQSDYDAAVPLKSTAPVQVCLGLSMTHLHAAPECACQEFERLAAACRLLPRTASTFVAWTMTPPCTRTPFRCWCRRWRLMTRPSWPQASMRWRMAQNALLIAARASDCHQA